MSDYYSVGGKNAEGQEETPHVIGKVYFEIRCAVCNTGLCKEMRVLKSPRRKQNVVMVNPCPNCLEAARRKTPPVVVTLNADYQEKP